MKKDRDLSPLEFYDILQKEYFENLLKSKIYPKRKDKSYYKKVMRFKKEKILDISGKNGLPNIFEDEEMHDLFRNSVFPKKGLPKINLTEEDIQNYYSIGSDVKIDTEDGRLLLGKIVETNKNLEIIQVKVKKSSISKSFIYKDVTRIL